MAVTVRVGTATPVNVNADLGKAVAANVMYSATEAAKVASQYATEAKNAATQSKQYVSDVVKVQDTQPTSELNRIWIKEDEYTEYQVPTKEKFDAVATIVNNLNTRWHYDSVTLADADVASGDVVTIALNVPTSATEFCVCVYAKSNSSNASTLSVAFQPGQAAARGLLVCNTATTRVTFVRGSIRKEGKVWTANGVYGTTASATNAYEYNATQTCGRVIESDDSTNTVMTKNNGKLYVSMPTGFAAGTKVDWGWKA